jgi:hypothetical protein
MSEPRTVTVTGWLARHQVRQHLKLHRIVYREKKGDRESTFTVREADEAQWDRIQQAKQEAER